MNGTDGWIVTNFTETIDAVFALAEQALAAPTVAEAARLRATARNQMKVCAVLAAHVRRCLPAVVADGGMIDHQAPAAGAAAPSRPPAAGA